MVSINLALRRKLIYIAVILVVISCAKGEDVIVDFSKSTVSISVLSSPSETRTAIDSNDYKTVHWEKSDKIYLWAKADGESEFAINNIEFVLCNYSADYSKAVFTSDVSAQAAANYTYYATHPTPTSISGNTVNFSLPAAQSGNYDGKCDLMLANPAQGAALGSNPDENVKLSFKHLTHVLRIEIPEGRDKLTNTSKLIITFPQDVVGNLAFDITNPNAAATFTAKGKTITVTSDKPFSERDYIWLFVNPTTINGTITFTGYTKEGFQSKNIIHTLNKTLEAGRITPIKLTIPDELPRTTITLKETANNLGEKIQKVTFTAPTGAKFVGEKTAVTLPYNASNTYSVHYYSSQYGDKFAGKAITVKYESEHAIVAGNNINITASHHDKSTTFNQTIPYLFFEDFGTIKTFDKNTNYTGSDVGEGKTIDLKDNGLPGWTADRAGGEKGTSLRTACRLEGGAGIQAKYKGRIDSPAMSNIKSGKTVKVKVSYNYSGGRYEKVGRKKGTPKYRHGYTDNTGALSAADGIENKVGNEMEQGIDGAYSKVNKPANYEIEKCQKNVRLSWYVDVSRGTEFMQNGNYWLYIDNVRVQIVP